MTNLLYIWILIHIGLFLVSFNKIRNSKENIKFIYNWAFIFGAFVYEDLLIFSLFNILAAVITLGTQDLRIGLLLILCFGIVRAAGETLYFFLQQFIRPKFTPHDIQNHFKFFRILFGGISEQKVFIIMQVFHQTIMIFFIAALIMLLLNWDNLPRSF